MKRCLRSVYGFLLLFGFDPLKTLRALRGVPAYLRDRRVLRAQRRRSDRLFAWGRPFPCLADRFEPAGVASGHYFHQDLLVARRLFAQQPRRHLDVGSRIGGFVAHVASFRPIEVLDIRPLSNTIPNVTFHRFDLMRPIPDTWRACCDSLSCLHALEHFGLGRYGDPLCYEGYRLGLDHLLALLQPGGRLYLSVPIGPQRIEFNAHRVFAIRHLLDCLEGRARLDRFSYVDDAGDLHEDVSLTPARIDTQCGCHYGCGIFEMIKTADDDSER